MNAAAPSGSFHPSGRRRDHGGHNRLVAEIAARAQDKGLLWHYCPDSRECHGPRGFPDLVIAGPAGIIFAEVKSDDDVTSPEQDLWIWTIAQATTSPILIHVWRRSDLLDQTIERELNNLV
jgi:hypothetical protein